MSKHHGRTNNKHLREHGVGREKGFITFTEAKEAEMKRLQYIKTCNLGISKVSTVNDNDELAWGGGMKP